jgi:two-component system chemotaxis response regulator CheY
MRTIVTRALHHLEGVDGVVQAESAERAIELLQSEPVDIVLCDWNLGGMTGIELLEALRAASWDIPFGFITAESNEKFRRRAVESGAAFLLSKPFTEAELARALGEVDASVGDASFYEDDEEAEPCGATEGEPAGVERARQLEEILYKLCDTAIHVVPSKVGPDRHSPRYVATYHDEDDELSAMCVLATSFGLAAAASLTRWSPKVTKEWVGTGIIPPELLEDLSEVANVLAQFVRADGHHVALKSLEGYAPGERFAAIERIDSAPVVEHYDIVVENYWGGLCTVVAL